MAEATWVSSHSDSSFFDQSDELVASQQNQNTIERSFTISEDSRGSFFLSAAQNPVLQEESPYKIRLCVTQSNSRKQSFIAASIKTVLFDPRSNDDGITKCSFAAIIEERLGIPLELSPLLPRRTSCPKLATDIIVQGTVSSNMPFHLTGKTEE